MIGRLYYIFQKFSCFGPFYMLLFADIICMNVRMSWCYTSYVIFQQTDIQYSTVNTYTIIADEWQSFIV